MTMLPSDATRPQLLGIYEAPEISPLTYGDYVALCPRLAGCMSLYVAILRQTGRNGSASMCLLLLNPV